jgi:hypothetical protein
VQPDQVVGRHRFFEPEHVAVDGFMGDADGLFAGVSAVRIDVQFGVVADDLVSVGGAGEVDVLTPRTRRP